MATGAQEINVKQLVLYSGSFGPREIDELREEISRDPKKFDELKEAVNELKTKDEDELSPAVRVKLGVCQFLIGKYDDSFASLKKGDGGALVHFYFAKLHAVKQEYDEAIAAYNTAQSAGYNVDICALGRAEVYRDMGKLTQSLQELDYLSGAVEQTAEYLYQRAATVNAIGGNPQEAVALYEKALDRMGTVPGGELEQAITCLNMADLMEKKDGPQAAETKIYELLDRAYDLLTGSGVNEDGYYAFVCEKCAPAFSYYGYFLAAEELQKKAEEIYERNRAGE